MPRWRIITKLITVKLRKKVRFKFVKIPRYFICLLSVDLSPHYLLWFIDPEEYETYLESRPSSMEQDAIALITSFLDKTK